MIPRTVLGLVEYGIAHTPVTLITGARQVGKTTLCKHIAEKYGFGYVSLANGRERAAAIEDPAFFLQSHPFPLIIDEVQYVPALFDEIVGIADAKKFETGNNKGMYVLTGSQIYSLMEGVTQSMAGRVTLVDMSALSMSEIMGREEIPFEVDFEKNAGRSFEISVDEIYGMIYRGSFPELYNDPSVNAYDFYSDYTDSYLERDVSQIINLKDKLKFRRFMEYTASITGQELVYDHIANALGINIRTVQSWISVLVAGGIIRLISPYFERSNVKRVIKRPKLCYRDTGLACFLARIPDRESLRASYLAGPMVETFIINEILKTHENVRWPAKTYYYRDFEGNEIDLVILRNGALNFVECKAGSTYGSEDIRAFSRLEKSEYGIGSSCVVCMTPKAYTIRRGAFVLPISSI